MAFENGDRGENRDVFGLREQRQFCACRRPYWPAAG
jgi:hypothetical protein